jgi:hypothetical protein
MMACVITLVMWKVSLGWFLSFRRNEMALVTRFATENSNSSTSTSTTSQLLSSHQIESLIKQNIFLQQIEKSLENIESSFDLVSMPLVFCSALFVSFLCYDMVANDASSSRSSWIAIPVGVLCVPVLLRVSFLLYIMYYNGNGKK